MQINNYHSDTIYLYWMYYVNCHSEINIKLVIWIVYIKLCSTFLTLILPGVGEQNLPPPCSFLDTVQKSYMLSMFKLYINYCYICVVTPKLWFGQKIGFWAFLGSLSSPIMKITIFTNLKIVILGYLEAFFGCKSY